MFKNFAGKFCMQYQVPAGPYQEFEREQDGVQSYLWELWTGSIADRAISEKLRRVGWEKIDEYSAKDYAKDSYLDWTINYQLIHLILEDPIVFQGLRSDKENSGKEKLDQDIIWGSEVRPGRKIVDKPKDIHHTDMGGE